MTETRLTEQLHRLAEEVAVPPGGADGDVARGRARLRRRRTTLAGGALVVACAGGLAWSAVDLGTTPTRPEAPSVASPAPAADRARDLEALVNDLARGTRSREDQLSSITLRQLRAVTDALRERVSGPIGWLSVGAFDSWHRSGADTCPPGWTCAAARVRGADRARWAEAGTVHQLAVDLDGSVHVFTLNGADERPAEVAWGDARP